MERARIEMVARVTLPDGRVIETTAQAAEGAPDVSEFDLRTEKGFRRDFGALEKGLVEAGREAERKAAELYMEAVAGGVSESRMHFGRVDTDSAKSTESSPVRACEPGCLGDCDALSARSRASARFLAGVVPRHGRGRGFGASP
jgi:hypothetical protein